MPDIDLDELRDELAEFAVEKKKVSRSPREERIIAGFEEIQKFVDDNKREPSNAAGGDIFERLYATRLNQIRKQEECRTLVEELDHQGLLEGNSAQSTDEVDAMDANELLAELDIILPQDDVTNLTHVKPRSEIIPAEKIGKHIRCDDFDNFKPIFEKVQNELKNGIREARLFKDDASLKKGDLFILAGQKLYIDVKGEEFINKNNHKDHRLRVIYDNGTESDILARSLLRALNKDAGGRRITDPIAGPLFGNTIEDDDLPSGTIYVLRSLSDLSIVKENHEIVHKIGVTGGSVKKRIANAKLDATYLLADVEVVATYNLSNINRTKIENIVHKVLKPAKLDIEIIDRFGNPVKPQEWFMVPLFIIDEIIEKITDQSIGEYIYDTGSAQLVKTNN